MKKDKNGILSLTAAQKRRRKKSAYTRVRVIYVNSYMREFFSGASHFGGDL